MKSLTDYENVVLVTIAKKRGWVEPPRNALTETALRHLSAHGMIVRNGGKWWEVKATPKASTHISARKRGRPMNARSTVS